MLARTNFFSNYFSNISQHFMDVDFQKLTLSAEAIIETHAKGRKVILAGNGGSASIASHVSVDFTKTSGIRAINFNEADLITCFANDYGYERWVEQALKFYADSGDLVILISSSGRSPNIVNAALEARRRDLFCLTFSGFSADNPLRELGDLNFWCDSGQYNHVEMVHQGWLLSLVDFIKNAKDNEKVS